jgi:ParB family chromosome partitioning protein
LPVLAVVDNLDDRALFVEMDRENRNRKDLSAWEQGQMYRRALNEGLFPSNRKLAEATGVDLGAVGKALSLADLPAQVLAAFASPLELQFRWAKPLNDALASDEKSVLMRAATLAALGTKLPAKEVFERLTQLTNPGVEPFNPPAPIEVQAGGKSAATLQLKQSGLSISFKKGAVPDARVPELVKLLEDFLSRGKPRK